MSMVMLWGKRNDNERVFIESHISLIPSHKIFNERIFIESHISLIPSHKIFFLMIYA